MSVRDGRGRRDSLERPAWTQRTEGLLRAESLMSQLSNEPERMMRVGQIAKK